METIKKSASKTLKDKNIPILLEGKKSGSAASLFISESIPSVPIPPDIETNSSASGSQTLTISKLNTQPPAPTGQSRTELIICLLKSQIAACADLKKALIHCSTTIETNTSKTIKTIKPSSSTLKVPANQGFAIITKQNYIDPMFTKRTLAITRKTIAILGALTIYTDDDVTFDEILDSLTKFVKFITDLQLRNQEEGYLHHVDQKTMTDIEANLKVVLKSLIRIVSIVLSREMFVREMGGGLNQVQVQLGEIDPKAKSCIKMLLELEQLFRNQSNSINILEGWLTKRSRTDNAFGKGWNKRYFILRQDQLLYSEKEDFLTSGTGKVKAIPTKDFQRILRNVTSKKNDSFAIAMDKPLILVASNHEECRKWITRISEVIDYNRIMISEKSETQMQLDWNVFNEQELKDFVKSLEREERYQIESTRMITLYKMTGIMSKIQRKDNDLFLPDIDELSCKNFEHVIARQEIFGSATSLEQLRRLVQSDPAAFLSVCSGLSISDFVI